MLCETYSWSATNDTQQLTYQQGNPMAPSYDALTKGLAQRTTIEEAKRLWNEVRVAEGLQPCAPQLLTPPDGNTKLAKTQQWGLSLLPHRLAGVGKNLCPYSTAGCRSVCLNTAGRGAGGKVQNARLARTRFMFQHPAAFATLLEAEILRIPGPAALRLNVFSDIPWETVWPEVFTLRNDLQFYDYTKWPVGSRTVPANYHLTYSASEKWTDEMIVDVVTNGSNVTVVLDTTKSEALPTTWRGLKVVDGDVSDARYDDPVGVVVALRAKGKARSSDSKFIRKAS